VIALTAIVAAAFLIGNDSKKPEPAAGHSHMGASFNEGPRQAAKLLPGQGKVKFPATTRNAEAQKFVEQGVGQLHGFWYFEAERSFRQAAALDPDCAIAYWGMACANVNNRERAKGFISKAMDRKAKASPRELRYIDVWYPFFHSPGDDKERNRKLLRELEDLVDAFPDDVEAKAFLALAIWNVSKDSRGSTQAADALAKQVLSVEPLHPVHHFVIHLWDTDGRAARALPSAAKCGDSAPGIAHMWHMSAHIYSKLHRYAEAAWQLEASARVDHAAMQRDRVMPYEIHNYAHNNDWLAKEYGKLGRMREALTLAYDLVSLPRHPKLNLATDGGQSAGMGRSRLLELLPQCERWGELRAAIEKGTITFPTSREGRMERAQRLGAACYMLADVKTGDAQLQLLEKTLAEPKPEPKKPAAEVKKNDDAKKPEAKPQGKKESRPKRNDDERWRNAVAELKARRLAGSKDFKGAIAALGKADLSLGEKARWLLAAGDGKGAESLARKTVADRPNEVLPLAVLVEVLHANGSTDAAAIEFEKLTTLAGKADLDFVALRRLKPFLYAFDLSGDWRKPAPMPADFGNRPALESLGPLTFKPWSAPDFTLPTVQGGRFSLEESRKSRRGVLVMFYLGSGCVHCVEQLQAFAPHKQKFEALGVPVVAVSTEDQDKLKDSLKVLAKGDEFLIDLASDSSLTLFKQYGVFDDFEKMPLHGTFLIDPAGKVRWRDVSFQPFTNPEFLLEESKRILER
jgi:peroxiredoxin